MEKEKVKVKGAMGEVRNDQCLMGYGVYHAMQVIIKHINI